MIGRVATFALSQKMIDSALRTQSRNSELTLQQSSGEISTNFGGLGSDSRRVLDLQTSITQSNAYANAATTAGSRMEIMYTALGQMTDLLTTLKSSITSATDAGSISEGSAASLTASMSEYLDEFASLLNTQYEGRYLFAGGRTDTAPVDLTDYPDQTVPSTETTDYYQGDDEIASVRVNAQQVVSYGITANDTSFEKALRAFSIMANLDGSSGTIDTDTLDEASTLAQEALDGVSAIQTKLSVDASTVETAASLQTSFQDQATSMESTLTDVDVAAAAAELSTRETQLKAAYSAIGKIQSLSLADYLN